MQCGRMLWSDPRWLLLRFGHHHPICREWEVYALSRELLLGILAECGLRGPGADQAIHILRSLVRGFVLHELMNTFLHIFSYDESFEYATRVFIAGLSALGSYGEAIPCSSEGDAGSNG
jgi:hypothetical protein